MTILDLLTHCGVELPKEKELITPLGSLLAVYQMQVNDEIRSFNQALALIHKALDVDVEVDVEKVERILMHSYSVMDWTTKKAAQAIANQPEKLFKGVE